MSASVPEFLGVWELLSLSDLDADAPPCHTGITPRGCSSTPRVRFRAVLWLRAAQVLD